jgi:hypothetical protein
LPHNSRRIGKDNLKEIRLRVEPNFHGGFRHITVPDFSLSVKYAVMIKASSSLYFITTHSHLS